MLTIEQEKYYSRNKKKPYDKKIQLGKMSKTTVIHKLFMQFF